MCAAATHPAFLGTTFYSSENKKALATPLARASIPRHLTAKPENKAEPPSSPTFSPLCCSFVKHWNRQFDTFAPWGGHTPPVPNLTLKQVFPALRWLTFEPSVSPDRVFNAYAFKIGTPDDFLPLPDADLAPFYVHGYFFNHRYWHPQRAYVLQQLTMHPSIRQYAELVYGDIFRDTSRESVSVHLRLGYDGEPATDLLVERRFPPDMFYVDVFTRVFNPDKVRYLVFSDDPRKARTFMDKFAVRYGLTYDVADENVLVTLELMARCKHHVLTSSTLSFWGAYLDPEQPHGGMTILHETFFNDHGRQMVPPEYHWKVMTQGGKVVENE